MERRPQNRLQAIELILYKNGMLMAFDQEGNQVPEVQEGAPFTVREYLRHVQKCARSGWIRDHPSERLGAEWPSGGLGTLSKGHEHNNVTVQG